MGATRRIFIAGHRGMVGGALFRLFNRKEGWEPVGLTHGELDLRDREKVLTQIAKMRPDTIVNAAAKVGGIKANRDRPVEFLLDNLRIQNNIIEAAHNAATRKLLFLGSSCIYPKLAPQPLREEALLTGLLEPTNEAYAIAKIAGIKLCQAYARQYGACFISAMPTNLYGPGDNYDAETSHVLPAMIAKLHAAKTTATPSLSFWGTGTPRREFLHVDDLAEACLLLIEKYDSPEIINIGTGEDIEIRELADLMASIIGYEGKIEWDLSMPDGTPRKVLDITKIKTMGWKPRISLEQGIRSAYGDFLRALKSNRLRETK